MGNEVDSTDFKHENAGILGLEGLNGVLKELKLDSV